LTEAVELQAQISKTIGGVEKSYREALEAVRELKERINELELRISEKGRAEASEEVDELSSMRERLNRVTDSLISTSEKAWEEYRKLEHGCKMCAFEPVELDGLKILCGKAERLAEDMLCYSLAGFKRESG